MASTAIEWISIEEAKERTVGKEEWWKTKGIGGKVVELKQHDPKGPRARPIRLYESGSMYLGEKLLGSGHGFGIYYFNNEMYKGVVFIGNWKDNNPHGPWKEVWLESSPIWIKNELPGSVIKEKVDGKLIGRPHVYEGNYVNEKRHDPRAQVTLKDGTCRVGPWENSRPLGDWWNDNDHPRAAAAADSQDTTEDVRSVKCDHATTANFDDSSSAPVLPAPSPGFSRSVPLVPDAYAWVKNQTHLHASAFLAQLKDQLSRDRADVPLVSAGGFSAPFTSFLHGALPDLDWLPPLASPASLTPASVFTFGPFWPLLIFSVLNLVLLKRIQGRTTVLGERVAALSAQDRTLEERNAALERVAALERENVTLSEQNRTLSEQKRTLEEENVSATQCQICFERQFDVLLSCGHTICQICADHLDGSCPHCRAILTSPYRRVYL